VASLTRGGNTLKWLEPWAFRWPPSQSQSDRRASRRRQFFRFVFTCGLFFLGREGLAWLQGHGRGPVETAIDAFTSVLCGFLTAYVVPFSMRHCKASVRLNEEGIILVRLWDDANPIRAWRWAQIDILAIDVMTLHGRPFDAMIVTTGEGEAHPIGLGRHVDRAAILARAESAGLGCDPESEVRTSEVVAGSFSGGDRPG
jgi:hypothetical protein